MVICPKCNKEIDYLNSYQSGEEHSKLYIEDGEADYDFDGKGFQPDSKVNEYECPECLEVLFTSEEEAVKFLKNDWLVYEMEAEND